MCRAPLHLSLVKAQSSSPCTASPQPLQYATKPVRVGSTSMDQGMIVAGRFKLFGLTAGVRFQMNPDGVALKLNLDFSALMDGFYGAIDSALASIGISTSALKINLRELFR